MKYRKPESQRLVQLPVSFRPTQEAQLRSLAEEYGISISEVARQCMDEALPVIRQRLDRAMGPV